VWYSIGGSVLRAGTRSVKQITASLWLVCSELPIEKRLIGIIVSISGKKCKGQKKEKREAMLGYIVWGIAGIVTYLRTQGRVGRILGFIGFGWVVFEMVILGIAVLTGNAREQTIPLTIFCFGSGWLVWKFIASGCFSLSQVSRAGGQEEKQIADVEEMPVVNFEEWDKKLCLGTLRAEGKKGYVLMDDEESEAGKYIIGTQGQGKSAFMTTLIEQDMCKGYSVIVVDAHGDLIDDVIARVPSERLQDCYMLDIEDTRFPFGLNLLAGGNFDDVELARRVNRVLHTFERLFPDTHGMLLEKYLGNIAPVFFANPGYAISDILDFLGKDDFREALLKNCHNPFVNQFWEEDFGEMTASKKKSETESLRTRLNRFVRSSITGGIIAQAETTIDFKKAIENKEIILVRLPMKTLPEEGKFIGTLLLAQIHASIFAFGDMQRDQRPGFSLYVDEVQNFANRDFTEIFTEGRKFKCRCCVAHQFRSQLPDFLRSSTLTARAIISFLVTIEDSPQVGKLMVREVDEVRKEDIESEPVKHLLTYGHEKREIEAFIKTYLRPLQTATRKHRKIKLDYLGERFWVQFRGDEYLVDDPEPYLTALLYECMVKKDGTLPIPQVVLFGFSGLGGGFYKALRAMSPMARTGLASESDLLILQYEIESMAGQLGVREREALAKFVLLLRKVMLELAKKPLAEKNVKDSGEVADELQKLKPREALVKISNRVYEMRTLDLTAPGGDLEARKKGIVARTRAKYCVPVSVVMEDVKKRRSGIVADDKKQGGQAKPESSKNNGTVGVNRFDELEDDL
jgi:Predicted ATPase